MTAGQPVRLEKLGAHIMPAGALPIDYWLEGTLMADLAEKATVQVMRTRRARQSPEEPEVVECPGYYVSSPVVSLEKQIDGVIATTRHSRWLIKPL